MHAEEHHLPVTRSARYYVLGAPRADVRELWVVCHGYAQLARTFVRSFHAIVDHSRIVVAPEALNRYYLENAPGAHGPDARVGATWMTREDREHDIHDYVAYLDTLASHLTAHMPHARITALGFSQGAATVSRWAAMGVTELQRLILWGSSSAHDLELHATVFRNAQLTVVAGDSDEYFSRQRVADEMSRMRQVGLSPRLLTYDGTHRVTPDALAELLRSLV